MKRWPPYAVAIATFIGFAVAFAVLAQVMLELAIARGALQGMPASDEVPHAIDVAFGSAAKALAATIALNATIGATVALLATTAGVHRSRSAVLIARLKLHPATGMQILVAILGLLGLTTALDSIVQLCGLGDVGTLADIHDAIQPLDAAHRVLFAGLIGIGPGVTEEMLFRGYLLNRIRVTQGEAIAVIATSIIFGLFHADPIHSPLAMVMGLFLGYCLVYTDSLWVPIAAHTANNALAALTVGWSPSELQAALLIPLGFMASGAAITLLQRSGGPLPRRAAVW